MQDVRIGCRICARFLAWLSCVALVVLGGCATPTEADAPAPADAGTASAIEKVTAEATVKAVDLEKRLVTLQRADGSVFTVVASDAVKNLPQVAVGDTVKVAYVESVVASLKKPGEAIEPLSAAAGVAAAATGQKPAGIVGQQITMTVKIESVDTAKNIVVFTSPDGGLRALNVKRPEFQEYIKGLKPGDQVEITYTEAVAISVE